MHTTIPTTIPSNRNQSSRTQRLVRAGLVVLISGTVFVACSDDSRSESAQAKTAALVKAATESGSPTDDSGSTSSTLAASPAGSEDTGAPASAPSPAPASTPAPPTTVPAAPAPVIDSFWTPDNIDCHNGNFQMFTAGWETTNAHSVTISIDGPGIYETYPADHEASLPFNCSTPHTFLLTAHGANGQTASQLITLHPRNVQGEEEEELS